MPAMAAKAARDQLQAAKTLLGSLAGTPLQTKMATQLAGQAASLLQDSPPMGVLDIGDLVTLVRSIPFAEADVERLLGLLTGLTAGPTPGNVDRARAAAKAQDYTALGHYVTEEIWKTMQSTPVAFMELCVALGLRKPDSRTLQTMSALSAIAMEGVEASVNMTPVNKNGMLKMVKIW